MWRNKDGKIYQGGGIVLNGMRHFNPSREQFIAAGWEWVEPPAPVEDTDFAAVKAAFWRYVDDAAAALSEATGTEYTRADFPTGAFSAELLAWCAEHGMSEADTGALAVRFCGIAADLARLGRNWNELFEVQGE